MPEHCSIFPMRYYGQIAPLDSESLPGRWIWRRCLLYLNQPASAPAFWEDVNPNDCLGVVWLHNPSSANRPNPVPPNWGEISVSPTKGDALWTISKTMTSVADKIYGHPMLQSGYVIIEELIYVDSSGVHDLWDSLSKEQIRRFSILNEAEVGPIKLAYPHSKFVWVAWGTKSHSSSKGYWLPIQITNRAMKLAVASGRDLVGVCKRWNVNPNQYLTFRFAADSRKWYHHENGTETQADLQETRAGCDFPLHPYDLGQVLKSSNADDTHPVQRDLVSALAKAITA